MGIAIMFIIGYAWLKNRKELQSEADLRRRARELLQHRFENDNHLSDEEMRELTAIARNSSIPESDFIREIMTEVDSDDVPDDMKIGDGKLHALITGKPIPRAKKKA